MTQRWALSHHIDEPFSIVVEDVPFLLHLVEKAVGRVDVMARHRWCNPFEFTFHMPLRPGRDKDGYFEYTVGNVLWDTFQALSSIAHRRERLRVTIPITREQAVAIDADTVAEWTDLFDLDISHG